jgi:hypothetical protein
LGREILPVQKNVLFLQELIIAKITIISSCYDKKIVYTIFEDNCIVFKINNIALLLNIMDASFAPKLNKLVSEGRGCCSICGRVFMQKK